VDIRVKIGKILDRINTIFRIILSILFILSKMIGIDVAE